MASKAKKEGAGNAETDRKNVIKQMKVKTTLKTDKSWINQKSAEERTDGNASPLSPQLKSLEGRKIFWSPTSDDKDNRVSSAFRDKDNLTRISSNPVQASNRESSYSVNEIRTNFTTSQASPPPSTDTKPSGSRLSTGYIIRGQPLSGTEKTQSSFNGYQKSYIGQTKSASLPRVPPASGYKMSTDTYKKLAPFNTRKSVGDLSDDETFSSEEQTKRTEAASGVLKDASIKERSYVFSAAKRNFETGVQDNNPSQFLAKRVEVKEEPTDKKRETSSKTLSSYLLEDAKWHVKDNKHTVDKPLPSHTSPPRNDFAPNTTEKQCSMESKQPTTITAKRSGSPAPGSPKLNQRITTTTSEARSPVLQTDTIARNQSGSPAAGSPKLNHRVISSTLEARSPVLQSESAPKNQSASSPASSPKLLSRHINASNISSFRPEKGKITVVEDESYPNEANTARSPKLTTRNTGNTVETSISTNKSDIGKITVGKYERVDARDGNRSPVPLKSLSDYLLEDTKRFETNYQVQDKQQSSQSAAPSGSPKLITRNLNSSSEKAISSIKPESGKITVVQEQSETISPSSPKLTTRNIRSTMETKVSTISSEPGKSNITDYSTGVKKEERFETNYKVQDKQQPPQSAASSGSPKLMTRNINSSSEKATSSIKPEPGKITVVQEQSETISPSSPKLTTRNTRSTVETNVSTIGSEPGKSNITDYSTGVKKEESTKVSGDIPKLTSWTTSHVTEYTKPDSRATPGKITVIPDESTAHNTNNGGDLISWSDLDETPSSVQAQDKSEKPKMDSSMIVSSNRPTPRSRDTVTTRVTESRYRDPGSFDNNTNGTSSHTTVSTTRSTDPTYIEYLEGNDSRSTRSITTSSEKVTTYTTTETRYKNIPASDLTQDDPLSSNKGVFVKEYVDTSENFRSPTHSGSQPDYFGGSEKSSYRSSSYLYSSAPRRVDEGPCTYCGRQIKDCAIIKLDNPSIYCHEYCFKCGICKKQMGDLMDSIFIHRDVVHCESCYEKLF